MQRFEEFFFQLIQNQYFFPVLSAFLFVYIIFQTIHFCRKLGSIRKDALNRSRSVIGGQAVEQLAPYLPAFPCNPNDAHFLGKPVDFVAFSGLTEKNEVDEILFIEVKSGQSALSQREKQIRQAVKDGRIRYVEYRFN